MVVMVVLVPLLSMLLSPLLSLLLLPLLCQHFALWLLPLLRLLSCSALYVAY
jgi:hypothetical protein